MAVTPFNATLADALKYVTAQVGTLGAGTVPTSTLATSIWEEQWGEVASVLEMNGISGTASDWTAESAGLLWVQKVEAYLTSGNVLLEKGSLGTAPQGSRGGQPSGGDTTAARLLAKAEKELERLKDRRFRLKLIADSAAYSLPTSGFASSDFTDGRDTTIDITFGGPNVDYIPSVPVIQDSETL